MSKTIRHWINNGINGFYHEFKNRKVYWAYRDYITESLKQSNFVQKAISNGFTPLPKDFRADSNWFGVSKQHPDAIISRGEKKIILSLQGMLTPESSDEKVQNLISELGVKYICFKSNDVILYESFFGEMPDNEFINRFIK